MGQHFNWWFRASTSFEIVWAERWMEFSWRSGWGFNSCRRRKRFLHVSLGFFWVTTPLNNHTRRGFTNGKSGSILKTLRIQGYPKNPGFPLKSCSGEGCGFLGKRKKTTKTCRALWKFCCFFSSWVNPKLRWLREVILKRRPVFFHKKTRPFPQGSLYDTNPNITLL